MAGLFNLYDTNAYFRLLQQSICSGGNDDLTVTVCALHL